MLIQPSKNRIPNRPQQRPQQQRPQQRRPPQQRSQQKQRKPQKKPQKHQKKTSSMHKTEQTSPFDSNEDSLIKTMKMYLNIAGLKRVNLNKLCTGMILYSLSNFFIGLPNYFPFQSLFKAAAPQKNVRIEY